MDVPRGTAHLAGPAKIGLRDRRHQHHREFWPFRKYLCSYRDTVVVAQKNVHQNDVGSYVLSDEKRQRASSIGGPARESKSGRIIENRNGGVNKWSLVINNEDIRVAGLGTHVLMLADCSTVVGGAGTTDFRTGVTYDSSEKASGNETESRESVEQKAKTDHLIASDLRVESLRRFVWYDMLGASAGVAVLVFAVPFIEGAEPVLLLLGPLLVLIIALRWSKKRLGSTAQVSVFDVERSLLAATTGNWLVALAVTWLVPFLWPIMVLTVVMTVVLVTPHLSKRALMVFIVAAAILGAFVGVMGLLRDDDGIIEDIDDTLELMIVTGALATQIVPIGLLSWQTNDLHWQAFFEQVALTETLQESEANLSEESRRLVDSRRRVVEASTAERSRIERDLHDGAQQRLAAIGVRLRLIRSTMDSGDQDTASALDDIVGDLDAAIDELRELAHGIYPPLLEQQGLPAALQAVARRSPAKIDLDLEEIGRHDRSAESTLYFTCLEALANAHKHAPGSEVRIGLRYRRGASTIDLSVADNGPGFDQATTVRGRGMHNMADRLLSVGGSLDVISNPGKGVRIIASLPAEDI